MSARDLPDARGHFDRFGGRFVPEALQAALSQLTGTFEAAVTDPDFLTELEDLRREYAGRPSPLTEAPRFSQYIFQQTGHQVRVLLKREDLNHTGSHKINNVRGQLRDSPGRPIWSEIPSSGRPDLAECRCECRAVHQRNPW